MSLTTEALAGNRVFFVASGAGSRFQHDLWMTPGTSGFLVGAAFPYAMDDTDEFLGFKPEKYCSREEALQLAMEAYMRAARGAGPGHEPVGVGLTAAVASVLGQPRRGDHRVFAAAIGPAGAFVVKKVLFKNPGVGEEQRKRDNGAANLAAETMLRLAVGDLDFNKDTCLQDPTGVIDEEQIDRVEEGELREIFFKHPYFGQGGDRGAQAPATTEVFYPGSFNPLHDGHRQIARNLGTSDVAYMVNVDSLHKPPMSIFKMLQIAAQFRTERLQHLPAAVLFTRGEPLFVDKFAKHPECAFVVGVDTFDRMLDPKWGIDPNDVLEAITDNATPLLVCDRIVDGVHKRAVDAINRLVPAKCAARHFGFIQAIDVEPSELSSSAIRAARGET